MAQSDACPPDSPLSTVTERSVSAYLDSEERVCPEYSPNPQAKVTVTLGAFSLGRRYPFATRFEVFDPGWESHRVDAEAAGAWHRVPPFLNLELEHGFTPSVHAYVRMGLRRDLAAWHRSDAGGNLPLSAEEVDANEPTLAYLHADSRLLSLAVGRFPVHWSPSPKFGLTLSRSVPYHDAVMATLKARRFRFHLLVSSLDPWLQGTPTGDSSGTGYPAGSEEDRQRRYRSSLSENSHRRVYDARLKTLLAHRLEADLGPVAAGITELAVIGGKVPDLQDANPMMVWHNNFKYGYVNSAVSADFRARLPLGLALFGEVFLDDLRYSGTESESDIPNIVAHMTGISHAFQAGRWRVVHHLHWIRASPYAYWALQPYNTLYSRRLIASNYTGPGGEVVVDRLVADHPLGYARGGDTHDFWYGLEVTQGPVLSLAFEVGLLAKGDVDILDPAEGIYSRGNDPPTGVAEEEVRVRLEGRARLSWGVRIIAGLGWQGIDNPAHTVGPRADRVQASLSASWSFPR